MTKHDRFLRDRAEKVGRKRRERAKLIRNRTLALKQSLRRMRSFPVPSRLLGNIMKRLTAKKS